MDRAELTAHRSGQTRADLLAAALRVFKAKGYRAASVAQIAAEARRGHGTFYLHFANKQAVFAALIEDLDAEMQAESRALWRADDVSRSIYLTVQRFFVDFAANRQLWAMLDQMAAVEKDFAELRRRWWDGFVARVRRGIDLSHPSGVEGLDHDVLAALLASMLEEACRSAVLEGRRSSHHEVVREVAAVWLLTIGHDPAALADLVVA